MYQDLSTCYDFIVFWMLTAGGLPVILTETGHFDGGRAQWIREIAEECEKRLLQGIDLRGVCIYPVIERPDWDDLNHPHK